MYTPSTFLGLLTLLASAHAAPNDSTPPDVLAATKITKTVVITETQIIEHTVTSGLGTTRSTSYPDTAPPKTTSNPRPLPPIDLKVVCPAPSKPCIIDGIAIWPPGPTTWIVLSSTLDALNRDTTMKSTISNTTSHISSGAPYNNSTTLSCSHTVPSKTTTLTPVRSNPGSITTHAAICEPQANQKELPILPIDMKNPLPAANPKEPTAIQIDSPTILKTLDHDTDPARRTHETTTPARHPPLRSRFFAAALPPPPHRPATSQIPPQTMRDEDDDEVDATEQENPDQDRCVKCAKNRDLVCINNTHYGQCDEGCVEPRILEGGIKCVEGKIYGIRLYDGDGGSESVGAGLEM